MLEVQKYLKENGLQSLKDEYKINVVPHPSLPISIYNYDQLNSPRQPQITRECRCLILDNSFELVARSFFRFFNLHEFPDEHKAFDWQNYVQVGEKLDGSLVSVFYYGDSWHVTTRQSWAESNVNCSDITWKELIHKAFPLEDMNKLLDKNLTYIFELTSPFNKVVRQYNTTSLYLLTIFNKEEECRDIFCNASVEIWQHLSPHISVNRPHVYSFSSFQEVEDWLRDHSNDDPTFEGFVLRDCNNYRVKAKSTAYWALSRLKGESNNLFHPKYIIPLVIDGELPEALAYFEEATEAFNAVIEKLEFHRRKVYRLWENTKNILDKKDFALQVKDSIYAPILFEMRKSGLKYNDIIKNRIDWTIKNLM